MRYRHQGIGSHMRNRFAGLIVTLAFLAGCGSSSSTMTDTPVSSTPDIVSASPADRAESAAQVVTGRESDSTRPRNIILLISDGCGPASFMMARDFARSEGVRESLFLDEILVGSVRTSSGNREVTDSAAGATAFACGVKANHQAVGVDVNGTPVRSVLEIAEDLGMATGIVANKAITDATPAAFTAHVPHRYDDEPEIAIQQISGGFDLLFGGGLASFLPEGQGGKRKDGRNLIDEARDKGYRIATDRESWDAVTELPVLALLADKHLDYEIDRVDAAQPTFPDIVAKSIDLLNADSDGFFLMAEGSLIDIAGHANDAAAHVHDILAYDDAVKVALDFARRDGNTLVISVSDHETGGLTVGRSYRWDPSVLAKVNSSHNAVRDVLGGGDRSIEDVRQAVASHLGVTDLSDEEIKRIQLAKSGNELNGALAAVIGDRAKLDWTSFGHTGVDVNLYAFGPGSRRFGGNHDNTHVGIVLKELLAQ